MSLCNLYSCKQMMSICSTKPQQKWLNLHFSPYMLKPQMLYESKCNFMKYHLGFWLVFPKPPSHRPIALTCLLNSHKSHINWGMCVFYYLVEIKDLLPLTTILEPFSMFSLFKLLPRLTLMKFGAKLRKFV